MITLNINQQPRKKENLSIYCYSLFYSKFILSEHYAVDIIKKGGKKPSYLAKFTKSPCDKILEIKIWQIMIITIISYEWEGWN